MQPEKPGYVPRVHFSITEGGTMKILAWIAFHWFEYPVCPHCSSEKVTEHGFKGSNYRVYCTDCKKWSYDK